MANRFPWWKNLLVVVILLLGVLYALPNLYGENPAVQISAKSIARLPDDLDRQLAKVLGEAGVRYLRIHQDEESYSIELHSIADQLKTQALLQQKWSQQAVVALNLMPATPAWLAALGAEPMKLGLDLRGGVHFLLDVDFESVVQKRIESIFGDTKQQFRQARLAYQQLVLDGEELKGVFRAPEDADAAERLVRQEVRDLELVIQNDNPLLRRWRLNPQERQDLQNNTMEQTLATLRNRVNELGVAEALVQRQGAHRVVVELPGIQDTTRAKGLLGKTATLEFLMQDDSQPVPKNGIAPTGTKIYKDRFDRPVLLKKRALLTGEAITSATTDTDREGRPAVSIKISGPSVGNFSRVTRDNIGHHMAVVYIESQTEQVGEGDKQHFERSTQETVISLATIQSALGNQFQITGLSFNQARDLSLLLRAGALPAAVSIVEERTIGPSLGQENIEMGMRSIVVGMTAVLLFTAIYYGIFGLLADMALVLNVVLLVSLLSMLGATLTLPGIAGIVLTVGMAVDANVLIFERIREELRLGLSPAASIHAGFERAFVTILDSNISTFIVGILLFSIGSGPIRGFAVTLCIGLLTSVFTAVTVTRAMVNLGFGGRRVVKVPIGM